MKTCIDCSLSFELSNYVPKASNKGGYEHRCRGCRSIKYNKGTPKMLAKKLYSSQKHNSAMRGQPMPAYTLEEFHNWLILQPNFKDMYSDWVNSSYDKALAPSVDRKVEADGYVFPNLQLMTWSDNKAKAWKDRKANNLIVNQRAVNAYDLEGVFVKSYLSISEALRDVSATAGSHHGIVSVCNGLPVKDGKGFLYMPKTYKGFIWKWA